MIVKMVAVLQNGYLLLGGNDANLEVDIQNMKMIPLGGNWYKIMFGKQQKNSYKVKIIKQRNKYKICDIINNNTI